jgi:hypothetical protein
MRQVLSLLHRFVNVAPSPSLETTVRDAMMSLLILQARHEAMLDRLLLGYARVHPLRNRPGFETANSAVEFC